MREILFRGKRLANGEWVEGNLFVPDKVTRLDVPTEILIGTNVIRISCAVDPTTICEYTGLCDKNGVNIFEGDIVHIVGDWESENWRGVDYNALIAYLDGGFCAIDGTIEEHGFRRYALARMDFTLEVIGNKWDNPELLEGME